MALQNFVDKSGPVISAAWLNVVDALKFTVFGDATTKAAARVALTSDAPLEVGNGGTGARTLAALGSSLSGTAVSVGSLNSAGPIVGTTISGTTGTFSGLVTAAGVNVGANDSAGRGMAICRSKAIPTTRNTTTTLTDDPDLIINNLPIGTWLISVGLGFYAVTTGTQGIKFAVAHTNNSIASKLPIPMVQMVANAQSLTDYIGINLAASFGTITTTGGDGVIFTFPVVIPTVGKLSVQWSQATSSANNTIVVEGSYLMATQIS